MAHSSEVRLVRSDTSVLVFGMLLAKMCSFSVLGREMGRELAAYC